jgi:enterochelin esterase-like enzyme
MLKVARSLYVAARVATPLLAQTRTIRVPSKILGEERIVHVSLPPNYSLAKQRYEVTYLLDGHVREFFDLTVAAAGYDLTGDTHDYATPPQIVVGVDQRDRSDDLNQNQEAFTRFLTTELVPFIDREYRTSGYRTLIGHSLAGRFALMTLCRAPGVFPSVIAISAAGGDSTGAGAITSCLSSAIAASGSSIRQIVLSAGEREPRLVANLARLREFLHDKAPATWRWTIVDGTGLGHTETPLATIPPGIRFVHDKSVWEMPPSLADSVNAGQLDPERAIGSFYSALSARVGATVSPSRKWMLAAAGVHLRRGDAEAEPAVRRLIAAYPEDLEGYGLLSDLMMRRNDRDAARQALLDARRMLDRLELHDVYERERKRRIIDDALAAIPR